MPRGPRVQAEQEAVADGADDLPPPRHPHPPDQPPHRHLDDPRQPPQFFTRSHFFPSEKEWIGTYTIKVLNF
jgi:hypothetical protein